MACCPSCSLIVRVIYDLVSDFDINIILSLHHGNSLSEIGGKI